MRLWKHMSFQKKLLVMVAIPLAVLGIVIGTLSYQKAGGVVKQSQKRVLSDGVNRVDISINLKARQINSFMQVMSSSIQIRQLADWYAAHPRVDLRNFDTAELRLFCVNTWDSFFEINNVSILLGKQLVYTNAQREGRAPDLALLEALYQTARQYGSKVNWSDVTSGLYRRPDESAAEQILIYTGIHNSSGETIGLIVLEADPRALGNAMLTKQKILEYQTTFLLDRSAALIYSDNSISPDRRQRIFELYQSGKRKASLSLDGIDYYFCSQYNGITGWCTFTVIPERGLFPAADSLRRYIAVLVSLSVVLTSSFLVLLSWAITKPLARLTSSMKEVQDKNFQLQLDNDRGDEIGELTDSFNFMVNRINILVNQVYQERLAQKNAELEALQAQINPHFLYNTLDSINWMLIDRGERDISAIVVALGKLMQYSMDTNTSMTTLAEEYRNIKDYLMIQKNRLEDQLEFRLALESGLESFRVPKLILQPLVENAIIYGWQGEDRVRWVEVCAARAGDKVQVRVLDNGRGMTEAQLARYRQMLENDPSMGGNIGVRNVARRLQLHFNGQCRFEVESTEGKGTAITMAFPILPEEGENL